MTSLSLKRRLRTALLGASRTSPILAHTVSQGMRIIFGIAGKIKRLTRRRDYFIDSTVKVIGWDSIFFGHNCSIGRLTWLNVNHRNSGVSLEIGNNCFIGQMNFVNVGKKIRFGEYVLTASNCAFISSNHIHKNPFNPYISTGSTGDASIDIGANCFFGYNAMVIGNVRIGYGTVVGAGAMIRSDIPPLSMVVGNPARIIKRYSLTQDRWVHPDETNSETYPSELEYIENIKNGHQNIILPLSVATSSLGDI